MTGEFTENDRARWTCLIPAAGRGSRLNFDRPKILYPILGRSILFHLLNAFRPFCVRFVIVVSPEGRADISKAIGRQNPAVKYQLITQPEPTGMADAIWRAHEAVTTPHVAIVWGDQICLREETIRDTLTSHQFSPDSILTFPTVWKKNPYIHIQKNAKNQITKVLQAREGENMPEEGESDCGFFAFRSDDLFSILSDNRFSEDISGKATGEKNFLQLFPKIELEKGGITTLNIASKEESLGINTRKDAEDAEEILKNRKVQLQNSQLRVVMFAGGSGTATLSRAFAEHSQIELFILVNAYDDGLSTGRLRKFIPGFLGPSDIRKNVARMVMSEGKAGMALQFILEYRLPETIEYETAIGILQNLFETPSSEFPAEFWNNLNEISFGQSKYIRDQIEKFLEFCAARRKKDSIFDFGDCSLGNIILAGEFIESGKNFNQTIKNFETAMKPAARVLNVTEGEDYVLVAMKSDGSFLKDEAMIVSPQNVEIVDDIYLLDDYLSLREVKEFNCLDFHRKKEFLRGRERTPEANAEVISILKSADIIIYGPGTQHSSLFPSYLTNGISEAIKENAGAEKIFIANTRKDHEIQGETINTLVDKLTYYLNRKNRLSTPTKDLVSQFFFQDSSESLHSTGDTKDYLHFDPKLFSHPKENLFLNDWEAESGSHIGNRVLNEIISIANERAKTKIFHLPDMVSIIVPVLNEEQTLNTVLTELNLLNFQPFGLAKEIIVVDGGSNDGSVEISQSKNFVQFFSTNGKGRGAALRLGIEKSKGNIIVFFPSDDEYNAADLPDLVRSCSRDDFGAVFGSRAIKCMDIDGRIRDIYRGKKIPYYISKFGGMSLSITCLLLFNRFLSDPLTGLKIFNSRILKGLDLQNNGVDLESEIIGKLFQKREFILELPVNYRPRLKSEGKKMSIGDGISCLLCFFRMKFLINRRD